MIGAADAAYLRERLDIFQDMPPAQLERWSQRMVDRSYAAGAAIPHTADDAAGLVLLKDGILRIYLLSGEGREITLFRLRAGDFCVFSASCALNNITLEVQIEAETDCRVLALDNGSFAGLCRDNRQVESYFNRLMGERLTVSMQTVERVLFLNMEQRLAYFLAHETGLEAGGPLPFTHDQIARHIGCSREAVTRLLKQFADRGLLRLARGCVQVLDRVRLEEMIP